MAAILDQGGMAYVSLGRGGLQTRDFAVSTYDSENPCKFPVVYREPSIRSPTSCASASGGEPTATVAA
jgi:hypothetical protein